MKDEVWLVIEEFPLYEVSNYGRVRTQRPLVHTKGKEKFQKKFLGWRILKTAKLNGYPAVTLRGETGSGIKRLVYVHRIMWKAFHGPVPEGFEIDHVNRERADNNLTNLRLATVRQNAFNSIGCRPNKTGIRGVFLSGRKFRVRIRIPGGKRLEVGSFSTKQEAARAYAEAVKKWHGSFALNDVVEV